MYSLAANLSTEPISWTSPSGSTTKEIEGLAIWFDKQVGTASITPPTLQKASIYSAQLWNKDFIGITTFLASIFYRMSIICSISPLPTWIGFFRRFERGRTWSMFRYAWPLPLNSSSILNSHVCTYRLFAMSLARESRNSCSSYISTELIGVGTSAS